MKSQKEKILAQYASATGSLFYRYVMGDGSDHIHYGLYENVSTEMRDALKASCRRLLSLARENHSSYKPTGILDLGAGAGGPAKCLLEWTEARVTCVDWGTPALQLLENWAQENKMSDRLRTYNGSFEALPSEWTDQFNLIWSQEAICHAADRSRVFSEARRVLNSEGVFLFSDILLGENISKDQAAAFSSVNAVRNLGKANEYHDQLKAAGFSDIQSEDWSHHLAVNFSKMLHQIDVHRNKMIKEGISAQLIDTFAQSLEQRLTWKTGSVLKWMAFKCK